MKKMVLFLILCVFLLVSCTGGIELPWNRPDNGDDNGGGGGTQEPGGTGAVKWAGIRFSSYGMRSAYGKDNFPDKTKTSSLISKMRGYYDDSKGTCILIVGTVSESNWTCSLDFPLSKEIDLVYGSKNDRYEDYLTAFDNAGYSVWLQVEPGNADLVALAKEVMTHYKNHTCVKGFGIDVEWYRPAGTDGYGTKLTATEARKVLTEIRKIKSDYTLFIKHWDRRWLTDGKSADEGIIYVNDSQNYLGLDDDDEITTALINSFSTEELNEAAEDMIDDFSRWAKAYYPSPVMFQIGYEKDTPFWKRLYTNPAKGLGEAIAAGIQTKNDIGIIWVDFTVNQVL